MDSPASDDGFDSVADTSNKSLNNSNNNHDTLLAQTPIGTAVKDDISVQDLVTWTRWRDTSPSASTASASASASTSASATAGPSTTVAAVSQFPPFALLRPSLKPGLSSTPSRSSSSLKNVRFAHQLTTVKRFDTRSEPISISTENSPQLAPICDDDDGIGSEDDDGGDGGRQQDDYWFGTALSRAKLPLLSSTSTASHKPSTFSLFDPTICSESDGDSSDCDLDLDFKSSGLPPGSGPNSITATFKNSASIRGQNYTSTASTSPSSSSQRFIVDKWLLLSSDIQPLITRRALDLQSHILAHLKGHNIKLNKVSSCLDSQKIQGLIYVTNLHFEKSIEIKFTFNNWQDVHYVPAYYHRTVTNAIDEFKFTIDLTSLSFFMQSKNLLHCNSHAPETCCSLKMELCCRYDVNGETYYDNNNYNNYHVELQAFTHPVVHRTTASVPNLTALSSPYSQHHSSSSFAVNSETINPRPFGSDFLISTTLSHSTLKNSPKANNTTNNTSTSRKFSDNTDYYNTSPLKHLFHNDTTLAKPSRINEVTFDFDTTPTTPIHYLLDQHPGEKHYTHSPPLSHMKINKENQAPKPATLNKNSSDSTVAIASLNENSNFKQDMPISSDMSSTSTYRNPLADVSFSTSNSTADTTTTNSSSSSIASQKPRSLQEFSSSQVRGDFFMPSPELNRQNSAPDSSAAAMDYDKLVHSYCFHDQREGSSGPQTITPSFWTRHLSPNTPPVLSPTRKHDWML
ncbi:LANO_0C04698g1_1 [Lachancea nothofagi CBS 11611]|uniref:LANO_0C04698g1_1 n=1 Tax=Lachancea nothofagi CBS 11611 TaxID=1266666 RepID=A0A1G4J7E5_9SACH|nr:LANO_0C04698g1_1 [Lachancea nothofagi CBS 11611]